LRTGVHADVPGRLGKGGDDLHLVGEPDAYRMRMARQSPVVAAGTAAEANAARVEGDARHKKDDPLAGSNG